MSSLRHVRRRQCRGKFRHPSQQSALSHMTSLKYSKGERRLNVYLGHRKWH